MRKFEKSYSFKLSFLSLLSLGKSKVPLPLVTKCAFNALINFNKYMEKIRRHFRNLKTINIVIIDSDTTVAIVDIFRMLLRQHTSTDGNRADKEILQDLMMTQMAGTVERREKKEESLKHASRPSDRLLLKTDKDVNVDIYTGHLTEQSTEVIVNAANSLLQHAGGLAKVIADAAGPDLTRASQEYIKKHGKVPVSHVMHTTSGKLCPPVKYVIHAVGPIWNEQDSEGSFREIKATFFNTLKYASEILRACSISIPAISSGLCI